VTFESYCAVALSCVLLVVSGLLLSLVKHHLAEVAAERLVWTGLVGGWGLFAGLLALTLGSVVVRCQ